MPENVVPPFQGFGLGLRPPHYQEVLARDLDVDFFEVISENFMVKGGRPLAVLDAVRERYPIALHGVSMSIGSADGLRPEFGAHPVWRRPGPATRGEVLRWWRAKYGR